MNMITSVWLFCPSWLYTLSYVLATKDPTCASRVWCISPYFGGIMVILTNIWFATFFPPRFERGSSLLVRLYRPSWLYTESLGLCRKTQHVVSTLVLVSVVLWYSFQLFMHVCIQLLPFLAICRKTCTRYVKTLSLMNTLNNVSFILIICCFYVVNTKSFMWILSQKARKYT